MGEYQSFRVWMVIVSTCLGFDSGGLRLEVGERVDEGDVEAILTHHSLRWLCSRR
jgi:hypothetical protein